MIPVRQAPKHMPRTEGTLPGDVVADHQPAPSRQQVGNLNLLESLLIQILHRSVRIMDEYRCQLLKDDGELGPELLQIMIHDSIANPASCRGFLRFPQGNARVRRAGPWIVFIIQDVVVFRLRQSAGCGILFDSRRISKHPDICASRVGLTPMPTCLPGRRWISKGMRLPLGSNYTGEL